MSRQVVQAIGSMACETTFGWVSFAWSPSGLVAVTLPQPSRAEANSLLPPVVTSAPEPEPGLAVARLAQKLCRYFDGGEVSFEEPLDPAIGTPFHKLVWAITRAIPRGEVRTYGQIARQAGSPAAARAVGQAMARNPWPIIVPCHRVVGSDGQLTGFGGGLPMKRRMLVLEGALGRTGT